MHMKWYPECPECGRNLASERDFYHHMKQEHGWKDRDFDWGADVNEMADCTPAKAEL